MKVALFAIASLAVTGCSAGGTARQFDVPFGKANAALQTLLPSVLTSATQSFSVKENLSAQGVQADLHGPFFTIRRDELVSDRVQIRIEEGEKIRTVCTDVKLQNIKGGRTKVTVKSVRPGNVLFVNKRDRQYERARLDEIEASLR